MKIIITVGDCNGIGIEVMLKAIVELDNNMQFTEDCDISIAGNLKTIAEYLENYKFPVSVIKNGLLVNNRYCEVLNCGEYSSVDFGEETMSAGKLAAQSIEFAVERTINKEFDAMVTMPVSKSVLYKAGWKFPGHTEMLGVRCGVEKPLMILCANEIRIAIATIHIPIAEVPENITKLNLLERINSFNNSLKYDFGLSAPRIAVLGLNPHAGEDGALGIEETNVIIPVIEKCKDENINANGPFPADGFFAHGEYKDYDGILAMYHDQGLIPLKLLARGIGVNVTGGLPIVRTSPDHGTAFGIAGKNIADGKSAFHSIFTAIDIVRNRLSKAGDKDYKAQS